MPIEVISEHHLLFNGVFLRVPVDIVEQIAALPEVFVVTPTEVYESDPIVLDYAETPDELMSRTRELLDLNYIHNDMGITGAGVRVAVLDDPINYAHPRFAPYLDPGTNRLRGTNVL